VTGEGINAHISEVQNHSIKVRLSNGEEVWIEDDVGASPGLLGIHAELTIMVAAGTRTTDVDGKVLDNLGIEALENGKFPCKVVAEVTGYDVADRWTEADTSHRHTLVELDAGVGRLFTVHENITPAKRAAVSCGRNQMEDSRQEADSETY
jgi:hypothetical protein